MPNWHQDVKDVNDAIIKYGRLHTLYPTVKSAEQSQLKIKLRMKKWFLIKKVIPNFVII